MKTRHSKLFKIYLKLSDKDLSKIPIAFDMILQYGNEFDHNEDCIIQQKESETKDVVFQKKKTTLKCNQHNTLLNCESQHSIKCKD